MNVARCNKILLWCVWVVEVWWWVAIRIDVCVCCCFFFEGYGDHRDLHRVDRRQRQMCIRDRECSDYDSNDFATLGEITAADVTDACDDACDATITIAFNDVIAPGACGNAFIVTRTWTAVSYTHLRAHETVLDLVCRLLLEKKKKQDTPSK